MASAGDRYLPDLARCFAGEALVFSWADSVQALTEAENSKLDLHSVNTLLTSAKAKEILGQKVSSFQSPSQQSRSQFETRTAAINVTPSLGNNYDVEEIKKDTIWLSGEVKLAEDEALRIVVLEWQQQPAERLKQGYSDAELASLRDAMGTQDIDAKQTLESVFPRRIDDDFASIEPRRKRILNVYFKEQVGLLCISRRLQEVALVKDDEPKISDNLKEFALELDHTTTTDPGVTSIIQAIESRLQTVEGGKDWSVNGEDVNDHWITSELQCILALQEIMLLRIRCSTQTVATETLLRWIQMMAGCEFYANVQPGPLLLASDVESLQAIASLTTLAMLDPATAIQTLSDSSPSIDPSAYFLNGDAAHDLHKILLTAAEACIPQATPSSLAWALILGEIRRQATASKESRESGAVQRAIDQVATYDSATGRRTSSSSFQQSIYEEAINAIMNTSDLSDPATYLLRCTIEAAGVFDTLGALAHGREYRSPTLTATALQILQELLSVALSALGYTPEILSLQFSILSTALPRASGLPDAKEIFIKNDFLMDSIFAVALGRFPYEAVPFLRLCRMLASAQVFDDQGTQYITFRLRTMETYTQNATGLFASYHTVREDENLNLVALDNTVNMFRGLQKKLLTYGQPENEASIIAANTLGEVISESVPAVIRWQHSYSGLALIGAWLELHYLGQLQAILSPYESLDDVITECIGTLTGLLRNTIDEQHSHLGEDGQQRLQDDIINDSSTILQSDSDVADCIFEILEQELQAYRRKPSNIFNTSILVACIDFVSVFSEIKSERFWSLISKSSLLESYGSDSFLLSVVAGVEVPNQSFPLLRACSKLYDSVVRAVLQQSWLNQNGTKSSRARSFQPHSSRLRADVLMSISQSLYSAFEAIPNWNFTSRHEQVQVVASLAASFEQIIRYSNALNQSKTSLTSSFGPASTFLAQQIRQNADDLSTTTSVLRHFFRMEYFVDNVRAGPNAYGSSNALKSLLSLSITLVELGKLRDETPSALDRQLFNATPLFCRVLATSAVKPTVQLIQNLLDTVAKTTPVSLLGHLGSTSAISLLEILKLKLGDWSDNMLRASIWDLLSNLVGRNQQWLAIVILTGSQPERNTKMDKEQISNDLRGRNFLDAALKQLIKIAELDPIICIPILRFVINSQMNWSWANEAMKANKDFLPAIMSHVCNTYVDASDDLKVSYRNSIAAFVTDLSTIHLHHAKANRDTTTLKSVAPLLRWLSSNAINVASYKHSLHSNLRKNFSTKFGGLELNSLKRTGLFTSLYGENYYYDLDFANEVFKSEPQWVRDDRYRDQSFSAEFRRANLNLSVVDSEVKLLHSFLNICVEHSGYFAHDAEVQKTIVSIVKNALDANTQPAPLERIFDDVQQTRADIAISLLQRLVDAKAKGLEFRSLLKHAWACARMNNGSFEQAITDNSLTYWRSMLAIILLALQFQIDKRYMPPAADSSPAALLQHTEQAIPTILEIVSVVIGQGFRSVGAALQDQRQSGLNSAPPATLVSLKDLNLISTIFETILRMTRLPEFVSAASQRLIAEGSIQSCLLLYSWSHMLVSPELDNEPVYAGYCLRFLTSLSSLPPVTEELAVEGVLSRLLSSRITQKLQAVPDGAGHVDKRPHVQSLYNLWAAGLVPTCLNLLHAVGAPVAAEVSIFLNQFPNQLNRASVAFIQSQSRTGYTDAITSTVADEATSLALISFILNSFRNAGASAAVDPFTIQVLHGYDEHKKALSEDISDVVNSATASMKNRVIAVNEKELALAREGNGEGLAKKIVSELRNTLTCLKGEEVEEDK